MGFAIGIGSTIAMLWRMSDRIRSGCGFSMGRILHDTLGECKKKMN
jgi:hypothetical protein